MITIRGLAKSFGKLEVLKDITLDVRAGEVVAILGPSGSGKSTLLRCINGLEELTKGSIEVNGITVSDSQSKKERVKHVRDIRKNTGMVFQQFNLYPHKTALENVIEALLTVKKMEKSTAVGLGEELLKRVGLFDKRDVYPSRLSGGQQQRVAIVRAIAIRPRFLVFDEPTSALDPEMTAEVLDLISELRHEGRDLIIVTHNMGFAREVSDRCVFIAEGQALEEGDSASLFGNPKNPVLASFLARVLRY